MRSMPRIPTTTFWIPTDFLTPSKLCARHHRRRSRRDTQTAPRVLQRRGPSDRTARGCIQRRHPRPLLPGRPHEPGAQMGKTRPCSTAMAGSRSSMLPGVPAQHRGGLAGAGRGLRRREHPRRRRVRTQVAPGRPQGESPQGLRRLHRRCRRPGSPQNHLAALPGRHGRSNGGLLMGNMLTQRPDLFGAIVCRVAAARHEALQPAPRRRKLDGRIRQPRRTRGLGLYPHVFSLSQRRESPPTTRACSSRPRPATTACTPATPARWSPKCESKGHDVLLYENIEGGHGAAADNKQAAFMDALAYTFLWKELKK